MTIWTDKMRAELANLCYLARTALAGTDGDTVQGRMVKAAAWYSEAHPEVSSTASYKELCRQRGWRYA